MRINHNIAALNTYRQLNSAAAGQSKSMEKLSSGLRINRAGDDAAGLAISEKMRGQIRGLDQASANAQDGISLIQTAEGALNETHSMLQRMRELVVQANNGTNTADDKQKIQDEISNLQTEVSKLAERTEFNSQKLLDGSFGGSVDTTAATDLTAIFKVSVNGAKVEDGYKITTGAGGGNATAQITGGTLADADLDFANDNITDAAIRLTVDGIDIGDVDLTTVQGTDWADADTGTAGNYDDLAAALQDDINTAITAYNGTNGTNIATVTVEHANGKLRITSGTNGLDGRSQVEVGSALTDATKTDVAAALGLDAVTGTSDVDNTITIENETLGIKETISGIDTKQLKEGTQVNFNKTGITLTVDDGDTTSGETLNGSSITANNSFDVDSGSVDLQIGANKGQQLSLNINDMTASALAIDDIDVAAAGWDSTQFDADLDKIDAAITKVSEERSKLGAWQNRLDHTINNLSTSSENLTAAESRIRDVDYALAA